MNARIVSFIEGGCRREDAQTTGVYPESINQLGNGTIFLVDCGIEDRLCAVNCPDFSGEAFRAGGQDCVLVPLDHACAENLRRLLPFTAPSPVLREQRTIGLGDRLGIAADGQIRALEGYDAFPVFAQQSIRELTLTGRSFYDVLDCASFAVFRNGFHRSFGADGDHLKTEGEVRLAIDCGYTMITLDCSEHIHGEAQNMSLAQLLEKGGLQPKLEERYLGKTFRVEEHEITFGREELYEIHQIYGEAIDFADKIYHAFIEGTNLNFELSIDETATPTTPAQHYYVARELMERGVKLDTVAPRFCGEFQKGIDYIGDLEQYAAEFAVHAAIARSFGYKISIHSGSDKFSVFPISGRLSRGVFHVKTAGTNWLEAMRVVAEEDPALYREIHCFALQHFEEATHYYHVTTDLGRIPKINSLEDWQLPELFQQPDARQLLHITYGLILTACREDGGTIFRDRLYGLWRSHREEYAQHLEEHIGKHLALLYSEIPEG